ncbi:MAG: transglutaminase domain-containing protein [Candidatus Cohnella colombiensis]|uniref:Transglutaminase domain-containing protein n=1 Tax=Candidatus Cohnella colombiensis TaxID=3121368 RepID=A0AA95F2A9_9BACL|nr:MAG: transglutaminase domain-containing protein [Cohnella sp.]
MNSGLWGAVDMNLITWVLFIIVAFSIYLGFRRGASGSAKQLLYFLLHAVFTVVALVLSALFASAASPHLQSWLSGKALDLSKAGSSWFAQLVYTVGSGMRDLTLLRFAVLFLIAHTVIRIVLGILTRALGTVVTLPLSILPNGGVVSRAIGGMIGAVLGAGRALLFTALLFAYCALFPQGPMTDYIKQSSAYREAAAQIIQPVAGTLIEAQLPVFAEALNAELNQLWQRRYDVVDADLPEDLIQAAASIVESKVTDEAKARALYEWVGSRITYDDDKVTAYVEHGEWREQNPEMTFVTRKGVCIDYARLYASMARTVGLDVRVVTGLGYDGRGGYGSHAWNEVYLAEQQRWVSLDPTWAITGNWFDSEGFADTHIKQV